MDIGQRKYSNKSTYEKSQNEDNGADFTVLRAKNPYWYTVPQNKQSARDAYTSFKISLEYT